MQKIESDQFHKQAEAAQELLDSDVQLSEEKAAELAIQVQRSETLRFVEFAFNTKYGAANDVGDASTAAFIEKSSKKKYFTLQTLDEEKSKIRKIGKHEYNHSKHLEAGVKDVNLKEILSPEQLGALAGALNIKKKPEDIDWIEGFTELRTIREEGRNEDCAYLFEEVPAAINIEKLAADNGIESILAAFFTSNELLRERLRALCDKLMEEEIRARLAA